MGQQAPVIGGLIGFAASAAMERETRQRKHMAENNGMRMGPAEYADFVLAERYGEGGGVPLAVRGDVPEKERLKEEGVTILEGNAKAQPRTGEF